MLKIDPHKVWGSVLEILKNFKILLVEDTIDNQILIGTFLKAAGASVEIAKDGVEGVEMASNNEFDLVLMDLQMPRLDGYGALKILQDQGYDKPIVAVTAHAMKEEKDRALK